MNKYILVFNNEIVQKYESDSPKIYGGPWGHGVTLEVPENISLDFVSFVNGEIVEDSEAKASKEIQDNINRLISIGKADRAKCDTALALIAGFNRDRNLTAQQITDMQTSFAQALSALSVGRPDTAAFLIESIEPDGILVTSEMRQMVLSVLS